MKVLFRFISFLFLVAAIAAGVFDSVRSVSTSSFEVLSVLECLRQLSPALLAMAEGAMAHYIHPEAWRWVANGLSVVPAFAAFLVLSLVFWMAGYRKRRKFGLAAA